MIKDRESGGCQGKVSVGVDGISHTAWKIHPVPTSCQASAQDWSTYHTSGWEGIVESLLHIKILPPVYSCIFLFWQPTPIILPWRILWTEEPGGLQSMGLQRVGHDWTTNTFFSFVLFLCAVTSNNPRKVPLASWKWWLRKLKKQACDGSTSLKLSSAGLIGWCLPSINHVLLVTEDEADC